MKIIINFVENITSIFLAIAILSLTAVISASFFWGAFSIVSSIIKSFTRICS